MLEDITARIAALGLTVRAGMAATPGAARALARWTTGGRFAIAAPDETEAALAPLPAAALGLAPAAAASLASLGLRTVGNIAALPRAALASRFGTSVLDPLDRALGRAPEPVSPSAPPVRHAARLAFAEPVARTDDIAAGLDRLLATLCAGLEREGHGARRLVLSLYEPDGRTRQIHLGASRATRDPAHLARLFAEHLDDIDAAFGFDAMTLVATTTEAADGTPGAARRTRHARHKRRGAGRYARRADRPAGQPAGRRQRAAPCRARKPPARARRRRRPGAGVQAERERAVRPARCAGPAPSPAAAPRAGRDRGAPAARAAGPVPLAPGGAPRRPRRGAGAHRARNGGAPARPTSATIGASRTSAAAASGSTAPAPPGSCMGCTDD